MLQFAVLGSGSSGNSAVVCHDDGTRILVDAGLSAKQLGLRLEAVGIDPESLDAVVLTHEHKDHCGGLDVFCRKRETPLPVYATDHTCELVKECITRSRETIAWRKFEAGQPFTVGGMAVESFTVPHDAIDPVGFVFRCQETAVGVLSDVGYVTALIRERLQGVHTLFVEANYDEVMLQNDIKRPWQTKQRISSRHGHLSNDQAADLILSVASERLHRVVLGHLSDDCNAPEVASQVIGEQLRKNGFTTVQIECAKRKTPLPLCPAGTATEPAVRYQTSESESSTSRIREESHHTKPRRPTKQKEKAPAASEAGITAETGKLSQAEWAF